jgi:hypothetical protein
MFDPIRGRILIRNPLCYKHVNPAGSILSKHFRNYPNSAGITCFLHNNRIFVRFRRNHTFLAK